jgi:hypothetical protein
VLVESTWWYSSIAIKKMPQMPYSWIVPAIRDVIFDLISAKHHVMKDGRQQVLWDIGYSCDRKI